MAARLVNLLVNFNQVQKRPALSHAQFPSFKQMLQDDAWHITQRTPNERIRMAMGQYPRRTSGTSANRQASQVIIVRRCVLSRYVVKNQTAWISVHTVMVVLAKDDRANDV